MSTDLTYDEHIAVANLNLQKAQASMISATAGNPNRPEASIRCLTTAETYLARAKQAFQDAKTAKNRL